MFTYYFPLFRVIEQFYKAQMAFLNAYLCGQSQGIAIIYALQNSHHMYVISLSEAFFFVDLVALLPN